MMQKRLNSSDKERQASTNPFFVPFLVSSPSVTQLQNIGLIFKTIPMKNHFFALFAVLFTHGGVINEFAEKYSTGNMGGVFKIEEGKQYTNIRAALIESGAALPSLRRSTEVPFDFSPIFQNREVGRLFKMLLLERLSRFTSIPFTDHAFYETCFQNKFHQALSVTKDQLRTWLEGEGEFNSSLIRKV
jgi:hypothetical protein